VGTNLNAKEKENAYSYGIFIEIRDKAKSFGSTVKKNKENADIIIEILRIMAIAKDNPYSLINKVFKTIIKTYKKVIPLTLFTHFLNNLPIIIIGSKVIKINNKGIIS
jgi:hypothetical protein